MLVLNDSKVIFKNRHAENLMLGLCKDLEGFSYEPEFDLNQFFLNNQIFKAKLKPGESETRSNIFKRLD